MSGEPGRGLVPTRASRENMDNIKKVAITREGQQTQFKELDQNRPLAAIIQDICAEWKLAVPDNYSLQFSEPNRQMYITDANRHEIQNGNVLQLTESPMQKAQTIHEQLKSGQKKLEYEALQQLATLALDHSFAVEFISKGGHNLIIKLLTDGKYQGDPLAKTLISFMALMDHGIVSWDVLEPDFIKRVADCVNCVNPNLDSQCLQSALEIMESIVLHSSGKQYLVDQMITPVNIIPHLQSQKSGIQKNAIALINALFIRAENEKKKKIAESLHSKSMRTVILSHVIRGVHNVGNEMAHQLYVLQVLMMNLHEERMKLPVDPHDQHVLKDIEELRRIAFDVDGDPNINTVRKSQNSAKDHRKLGFQNQSHPAADFTKTPPGLLALDVMLYFARNHGENYVKVVLENSSRADEHDCPFVQASIFLTKILCDTLKIGEPPTEEGQTFYPMFFCHDKPFEEFFCTSIQLLNKTWREMRATSEDFQKVLGVVKEQITRALEIHPSTFDALRNRLYQLTYSEIIKIWEMERQSKEEWESQAKPIIELREQITPEIVDLIKQQRFNQMIEGTRFQQYNNRGKMKGKYWYWRLSPNYKSFYYGECSDSSSPLMEQLPNKLSVVDIKMLQVGKDCPHIKENKGRKSNITSNLAFSIVPDTSDAMCFVASNEQEFSVWTDGINALLEKPMTSEQKTQDLEMLLCMEIKIRLLETEGITIPTEAPPIPQPPSNFNFAYNV
ncbi:engulfment and cell motility protein 1-like [Gigantopelta aegis]|uniref:engulfment and cell motility protein 1-like n=1 Tax=Gigantopelta aegis TaxID=1735272 RepID=UPI001B88AE04|nr:engulfment and cell motility protein 1-like [Gigantopelta aegis]